MLVEEEGVRALCSLVPEDREKDRASNRGREWGWRGIGAVAALYTQGAKPGRKTGNSRAGKS